MTTTANRLSNKESEYEHMPVELHDSGVYMSKRKYEKLLYRDDGVCRWKVGVHPLTDYQCYNPDCCNIAPFYEDIMRFKFCPYCGKRIEVKEK